MNKIPTCDILAGTLPPCDLEWGHEGKMHANSGDGFYNTSMEIEHELRQKIRAAFEQPPFDPVRDVAEFNAEFGLTYDGLPRLLDPDLAKFRLKFLQEEVEEYKRAYYEANYALAMKIGGVDEERWLQQLQKTMADMLDALVDEVYVAVGTAMLHGFDFREAWRRVHRANMLKVRAGSAADSKRGHASDVVKPPGWKAPDHRDLVSPSEHHP